MAKLAIQGGNPAVSLADQVIWPEVLPCDEQAILEALRTGDLTTLKRGGAAERLEEQWAATIGAAHCVAVSNGTAAISLALAALGIGAGDQVIVPALTFIAPALACLHVGAIPIFADVQRCSFNIDPLDIEHRITKRTKAIVVVHLHGLPVDMDSIMTIATRYGLRVVEDAAQAHGASYHGKQVGTIGDVGTFSLSISKNLPTCGEGGLVTTQSKEIAARIRRLRVFGEELQHGVARAYEHHEAGWNNKINGVQAAFTLSHLRRFAEYNIKRESNVSRFLARLRRIPALICPSPVEGRTHAWHILRFRLDEHYAQSVSIGSLRLACQKALRAEGLPVREYQLMPLPAQPVFQEIRQKSWCAGFWQDPTCVYDATEYPTTAAIIAESFVLQKLHVAPNCSEVLEQCADAFEKVFSNWDFVLRLAAAIRYEPKWLGPRQLGKAS